ncbi:MAG: carboxypeptidase regulatory-like domain-containing protein [Planctomycetes bacterium]|nr:carboxypeptidase regulatory-like domain-containing protein [Planctomycetota bacterium]
MATVSIGLSAAVLAPAWGDGTVQGRARFERIKGKPLMGYAELYESNLFLSPDQGLTTAPSYRLGAPPNQPPRHDGSYSLTVAAGAWTALVNQPLFFIRPKVLPGILVRDGQTITRNLDLPIDYSTYFTDAWTVYDSVWIQTFVATGASITGVSWRLAGTNATEVQASLHADDGGADPGSWPLASPKASKRDTVETLADNWVRWRSGEVPTVPGQRYAVKLTGAAGGDRKFAVFSRAKDGNSYAGGQAFNSSGAPQNFDLNITVFSDSDGTAILYNKTTAGLGELRDGYYDRKWGQTFKAALGTSLAAVDVWAAGANNRWDLDFTFKVLRGGPGGPPIGPAKTAKAAYQAFGAGLHGVSYSPGEVPLAPGETYYLEFTNPEGFNPYILDDPRDAYPDGAGYQNGLLKAGGAVDVSLTIAAYTLTGGKITGQVIDESSRQPIAGAAVTLVELGRLRLTGAQGLYEFRDVPPGTYSLTAAKTGYNAASRQGIALQGAETAQADFSLSSRICALDFRNPGFESDLDGWSRYGDARNRTVDTSGGPWFGGITAHEGSRFHGNEINGCCLNGGLYQQKCAVSGHRYRASVWSNVYWISGVADDATNRIGLDPGGGTNAAGPITWSARHRQPLSAKEAWQKISVEARATGPIITIFLDFAQRQASGNQWRINCFDFVEVADLDAPASGLRRGDCDNDAQSGLADVIALLTRLFLRGPAPACEAACDANADGGLDVSDGVYLLLHQFAGGPAPPPPWPDCGPDPTADPLPCGASSC